MSLPRAVLALFCVFPLLGAAPAPRSAPRVVSMNMCADQLVIALADPGQIAALTQWSRDPVLSYYADRAQQLPIIRRSAEEVLTLRPDVVIGAPFRTKSALAPLKAHGVTLVELPKKDGLPGIEESIRVVAEAVGHPQRGEAMIASIQADLARIGTPGNGRVAAYYQRQGYLTGTGTLIDEMMGRVGLVNLAGKMGLPALSRLSVEELAVARPDFLITDGGARRTDLGTRMLHHPLITAAVPPARQLVIPQAMTVCGSPAYPKAVAMLAAQIRAVDGGK
jgi:iron complex transport system substrate-binding protein